MRKNPLFYSMMAFFCLFGFSCKDKLAGQEVKIYTAWQGKIELQEGVSIVKNPASSMYKSNIVDFQDEGFIPSGAVDLRYWLVSPSHLALDSERNIYVLDYKESNVKVFDEKGHPVCVIGRFGDGPGELDSPGGMDIIGDELVVSCTLTRRLTFFNLHDGKYTRSKRTPNSISRIRLDSKGNFYAVVTDRKIVKFQKYDADLKSVKTLTSREWYPPNYLQASDSFEVRSDDSIVYAYPLNHEYELKVFNSEGTLVSRIQKNYAPISVSSEDRAELENMMRRSPPFADGSFNKIPEHYEPFYSMRTDDAGRIFVQTRTGHLGTIKTYDVFSADGKFLSTFNLEEHDPNVVLWTNDRVYSVAEDEEGNPVIRVRKVIWKY